VASGQHSARGAVKRNTLLAKIQQHGDAAGDAATAKARERVDEMRRRGDAEGADTWLRIIVTIGTLGTPPTNVRR
jgi:hypothetical protein